MPVVGPLHVADLVWARCRLQKCYPWIFTLDNDIEKIQSNLYVKALNLIWTEPGFKIINQFSFSLYLYM